MQRPSHIFTSESVSEGHPDKVADRISDTVVDAFLGADPFARVACETMVTTNRIIIAGEVRGPAGVVEGLEDKIRAAVKDIGYEQDGFHWKNADYACYLHEQSADIAMGVDAAGNKDEGAGDQGIMFGYATDETPELLPLPIVLAHRLARGLAEDRRSGRAPFLRPDGKSQVSVVYEGDRPVRVSDVLVSAQHAPSASQADVRAYVEQALAPRVLDGWYSQEIRFSANPTGSFVEGGPSADAGVTGRKIIVDTYGGAARHGGGAFSGKDPSKVDRSGAYFCRFVARQIVKAGLARRAEIQVAYAIGVARPVSVKVDTFGTGDPAAAADFVRGFDFRPAAIIERLDLLRPFYRRTTNYGHFGKPELPWEQ